MANVSMLLTYYLLPV